MKKFLITAFFRHFHHFELKKISAISTGRFDHCENTLDLKEVK